MKYIMAIRDVYDNENHNIKYFSKHICYLVEDRLENQYIVTDDSGFRHYLTVDGEFFKTYFYEAPLGVRT